MPAPASLNLSIPTLGPPRTRSPLDLSNIAGDLIADFTPDDARLLLDPTPSGASGAAFELAGPREQIYFHGPDLHAGMVTCGGLCPGLNNVIRELTVRPHFRPSGLKAKRLLGRS